MAKIRTLKAEFFRNADVSRGGPWSKILAAGLVCAVADDEGRFKAEATYLMGEIFTHDAVDLATIETSLQHLEAVGYIRLYSHNRRRIGALLTWPTHQSVPKRWFKESKFPAPPNTRIHRITRRVSDAGKERRGKEGIGEEPLIGPPATDGGVLVLIPPVSLSPVDQVFEAWRLRWHPTAKRTSERLAKIQARLREGWSVEDLVLAVTVGAERDPWVERHVGLNDDVKNLVRNGSTVEKFLEFANGAAGIHTPGTRQGDRLRGMAATLRGIGQ